MLDVPCPVPRAPAPGRMSRRGSRACGMSSHPAHSPRDGCVLPTFGYGGCGPLGLRRVDALRGLSRPCSSTLEAAPGVWALLGALWKLPWGVQGCHLALGARLPMVRLLHTQQPQPHTGITHWSTVIAPLPCGHGRHGGQWLLLYTMLCITCSAHVRHVHASVRRHFGLRLRP